MRKRGYVIVMATAMVVALGMPAIRNEASVIPGVNAVVEEIMPKYEVAKDISATFSITNNTAKLSLLVNALSTKKVSVKMILQRKDGDSWTKVQTWNKTGTGRQNLSKSMVVTKGRKYRMKYTVTIGSETITDKTAAKTA